MANNIRDFNGISFFYELSSTGANGLKEIYREYIQETNKLDIKPMEQNGKEILSIFLNRVLTDDLILQDVNGLLPEGGNEDDKEDEHVVEGGSVPDGMTFDEYKQYVADCILQTKKNEYDEFSYSTYTSMFNDNYAPFKGRDFYSEILATESIEELNDLFDNLMFSLEDSAIKELYDSLKNSEKRDKEDFESEYGISMPEPNIYKYIKDIEDKKDIYIDERKHRHLDLTSIYNSQYKYPRYPTLKKENNGMVGGVLSKLTDLARQGELIHKQFASVSLNKYNQFSKNVGLNDYANKVSKADEYDVEKALIPVINQILTDGVNDELRDSLIAEGRSITTYTQLIIYSEKVIAELTPYLGGRSTIKIASPNGKTNG